MLQPLWLSYGHGLFKTLSPRGYDATKRVYDDATNRVCFARELSGQLLIIHKRQVRAGANPPPVAQLGRSGGESAFFLLFVHPRVSDVRMSLSRRFRARGGAVPLVVWLDGNFYTKVP